MRKVFKIFDWVEKPLRDRAIQRDYRDLFSSELGRRVLADILNRGGVAESTGLITDRRRVDVIEGRRQFALETFTMAGGARDKLTTAMINDNIKEALDDDRSSPTDAEPAEPDAAGRYPADPLYARSPTRGASLTGARDPADITDLAAGDE